MSETSSKAVAKPAGFFKDFWTIGKRAVRSLKRDPEAVIPGIIIPLFFFVVNIGALQDIVEQGSKAAGQSFDFKAFQLPVAILFAVTGISRASSLVLDIQNGYFERLLLSPAKRITILMGLLLADFVLVLALITPVVALGLLLGVSFQGGIVGILIFMLIGATWSIAFSAFPYAIALKTGSPAAVNSSFLLFFPFMFLTTAFIPKEGLTSWLATAATYNPVTYLLDGMRSLVMTDTMQWSVLGKTFACIFGLGIISWSLALAALRGRLRQH